VSQKRQVISWLDARAGRVFATGYAAKLSVDHSVFSVSTGSMLAARRAGT
jgi:hypothetical protein